MPLKFSFKNEFKIGFSLIKEDLFFVKNKKLFYKEINTMPQWAGSCWYFLRFIDPLNNNFFVSSELENYWMPVDLYIGGAEHAVLHLLYSRFWYKVLFDLNLVKKNEPFIRLFNPGLDLYESYMDEFGKYYHINEVEKNNNNFYLKKENRVLINKIEKMSKSKYNVVNPNEILDKRGADCLRLYELFLGPLNKNKIWNELSLSGMARFLNKIWDFSDKIIKKNLLENEKSKNANSKDKEILDILIKDIEFCIIELKFNVAISKLMTYFNYISKKETISLESFSIFLKLLCPFAPHISEEIWNLIGKKSFISTSEWPKISI